LTPPVPQYSGLDLKLCNGSTSLQLTFLAHKSYTVHSDPQFSNST